MVDSSNEDDSVVDANRNVNDDEKILLIDKSASLYMDLNGTLHPLTARASEGSAGAEAGVAHKGNRPPPSLSPRTRQEGIEENEDYANLQNRSTDSLIQDLESELDGDSPVKHDIASIQPTLPRNSVGGTAGAAGGGMNSVTKSSIGRGGQTTARSFFDDGKSEMGEGDVDPDAMLRKNRFVHMDAKLIYILLVISLGNSRMIRCKQRLRTHCTYLLRIN